MKELERYGFDGIPRCLHVENGDQCVHFAIADEKVYGPPQFCKEHAIEARNKLAFQIASGLNNGK